VERSFTARWRVRQYELDVNGHVNNSVYVAYAEEVATRHAEALGFGRVWSFGRGGSWVVRKHEITYHRPAVYGEELELTTTVESMQGARAVRRTTIKLAAEGLLATDIVTEWVWVRLADGRPTRIPPEIVAAFQGSQPVVPRTSSEPVLSMSKE
jgi:acyl-CoA thioester hydrolase